MSGLPPNLLYLTIYNPTLRPSVPVASDDEDAEEQAHILFYTSRDRAVSRDRMLRQVGLAKALVNFSELFNTERPCDNVHSQTRRLVMVSPEPDFWIHAAVELAKIPRVPKEKEKIKGKGKDKGKEREKDQEVLYDHVDASTHDLALRADLVRGYEQFKLIHGSLTSILGSLGREALELQLERFFTVWAWTWNIEDGHDLGTYLGIPLHPLYRILVPILDALSSHIPENNSFVIISHPYVIPSTRFFQSRYPPELARRLLSLIPLPRISVLPATNDQSSDAEPQQGQTNGRQTQEPSPVPVPMRKHSTKRNVAGSPGSSGTFLGMPAMNMNINMDAMDVRKWGWRGALTFGKGQGKKPFTSPETKFEEGQKQSDEGGEEDVQTQVEGKGKEETGGEKPRLDVKVDVDTSSLTEAMDTLYIRDGLWKAGDTPAEQTVATTHEEEGQLSTSAEQTPVQAEQPFPNPPGEQTWLQEPSSDILETLMPPPLDTAPDGPRHKTATLDFSSTSIHVPVAEDPLATCRKKLFYATRNELTIALISMGEHEDLLHSLSDNICGVLEQISSAIEAEGGKDSSLPSATKILQPQDKHIISTDNFTVSSLGFESKSEHLHNALEIQERDTSILEVFSRGQNPQHWHVTRRGLGVDKSGSSVDGEVYMEVSRKESSLTDVDNVLASVVRRFSEK